MSEVTQNSYSLDERAVAAKESKDEMERLIEDFRPFLHARASKYPSQGGSSAYEELFSAAMLAFYEAVQSYDIKRGHFVPFADLVVHKRIIDSIRRASRDDGHSISLEEAGDERFATQSAALGKISMHTYEAESRQAQLADEIAQFERELAEWGITMEALSKHSPKHQKLQKTYRMILSQILQSPDILHTIRSKRYFPIKAVAEITGLPPKKLERARIFILASLLIKTGDYDFLAEYVDDRR